MFLLDKHLVIIPKNHRYGFYTGYFCNATSLGGAGMCFNLKISTK